jgi:hypothetical protein
MHVVRHQVTLDYLALPLPGQRVENRTNAYEPGRRSLSAVVSARIQRDSKTSTIDGMRAKR